MGSLSPCLWVENLLGYNMQLKKRRDGIIPEEDLIIIYRLKKAVKYLIKGDYESFLDELDEIRFYYQGIVEEEDLG